jgi:superfamily I DNA/RNA helicase
MLMQHVNWFAYDCDRELVALALLQRAPARVDVPQWMRSEAVKNAAATVRNLFKRKYVLLDEFQDTSVAQLDVVLALTIDTAAATMTTPRVRLTVVGDSDQAIYAFRGASMQPLQARLESLVPRTVRYNLRVNHRSTPAIVAVCEALIAPNRTDDKAMRPSPRWGAPAPAPAFDVFPVSVLLCQAAAAQQESCTLSCIQKWHALGVPYGSMAVLCRVKAGVQSFNDSIRGTDIVVRALKEKEEDRFSSGQGDVAQPKQDALSVGTIHSAKGIEWDVVCIIDAFEAAQDIKARNDSNAALSADIKAERWAEERRVVFVGLSRSRRALHITHPIRAGGRADVEPAPSEFLQDIQRSAGAHLVVIRSDALDSLPWPHNTASLDMGPYGEDDGPE